MILITGANGFIGSALYWELLKRNPEPTVLVDTVSLSSRPELLAPLLAKQPSKFLLKDQLWSFLESSEAQKISWIFHMGANSSTTETNWDHLFENNTLYSQRIFEWCTKNQKPLIYASSAATYGDGFNGYDDETDSALLKPLNLYGKSKLLFDQWASQQTQTPPVWYGLKFFNVFGPNEYHKGPMASVVYKAFHQIRQTGRLQLFQSHRPDYKDGEQKRDFIYVKEITQWIFELTSKKPTSGIYNMGYGQARSWNELARATFSAMGLEPKIDYIEMPLQLRDQYQYFTEAKMNKWNLQGLSNPTWSLEKAVSDYVRNHLNQPQPYLEN